MRVEARCADVKRARDGVPGRVLRDASDRCDFVAGTLDWNVDVTERGRLAALGFELEFAARRIRKDAVRRGKVDDVDRDAVFWYRDRLGADVLFRGEDRAGRADDARTDPKVVEGVRGCCF